MPIHRLDNQTINQIAAGEVIERPAAVIKELIENSLDAGAMHIHVSVEQGGLSSLIVQDNGEGISKEDLPLTIMRHATSKIQRMEDLESIATLGFRGEALASIAAVSKVSIQSKHVDAEHGWQLKTDGGSEPILLPTAIREGTRITVKQLFFNTPARRRFMKKPATEFNHVVRRIQTFALGHSSIGFHLEQSGKVIFDLVPATTDILQEKRLISLLGEDFLRAARHLEAQAASLSVRGWIAEPGYTRAERDQQYFFVNGRHITSQLLNHAIRQAYHDVAYGHRHPAFVLFLEIDPALIDVNVHPTKSEIRFRDGRGVYEFLSQQIHAVLAHVKPVSDAHRFISPKIMTVPDITPTQHRMAFSTPRETYSSINFSVEVSSPGNNTETVLTVEEPPVHTEQKTSLGYAIGSLHHLFILAENEQGLIVVDTHAAHERILYEQLKKHYHRQNLGTQTLLTPIEIKLTLQEALCFEENEVVFESLGMDIRLSSDRCLLVRSTPLLLKSNAIDSMIRDIIAGLTHREKTTTLETIIQQALGTMACHSAIRGRHDLSLSEMNALLRQMETTEHSGLCNHGRPTWIQIPVEEVNRWFYRGR
ncbi:MAG TPA: DNA mismatch repair endonuclease MutL [Coxiellaceae bacterium]|nr:DNA mismatch repair endonuclease MutL [Coxiellaceae bacterium]